MSSILNVVANVNGRVFVDQNDVSVQMILAWLLFNIDKIEMELVANRICESLQRSPRRIYIIYVNDVCNDVLLERVPNLHHLDTINNLTRFGCKSSIYSNEQ